MFKIIKNKQKLGELSNIAYAAHNDCKQDEIMLVLGQNDALIGRNVLGLLNALYQTSNATVGFGCFLKFENSSS